jgi:hypothetical protein
LRKRNFYIKAESRFFLFSSKHLIPSNNLQLFPVSLTLKDAISKKVVRLDIQQKLFTLKTIQD